MATTTQYSFYQVASESVINTGYAAGAIVFNKTRKELTVFDTNAAATVYAGGLVSASYENQVLSIKDNTGQELTVDLSDFVTHTELNDVIDGYYDKLTVNSLLATKANSAEVYTKTEVDDAINGMRENMGDILTLRGTVGMYDSLPTTGVQKGDVYQVTQAGEIPKVYLEQDGVLTGIVAISEKPFEANAELYWIPRTEGSANTGTSMATGYIPAHWDILGMSLVDTSDFVKTARIETIEEVIGTTDTNATSLHDRITALEELSYWQTLN